MSGRGSVVPVELTRASVSLPAREGGDDGMRLVLVGPTGVSVSLPVQKGETSA
jgi:hypothetical protein